MPRNTAKVITAAIQFGGSGGIGGVLGQRLGNRSASIVGRIMPLHFTATRGAKGVIKPSDESLVEAYIKGDRSALEELINRYKNELLGFLSRYLGSQAAGEDVFQETFLQFHLSAETFDLSRRFKPWLFTIAANKARDYHRKHSKRSMISLSAWINRADEGLAFIDLLEADLPSPEAPVLDAERSKLVRKVVDSLPVHLREILLLSYFQRMSYNQIAGSLQIPLGTVKSRLHTAVAAFATAWKAGKVQQERKS